MGRFSEWFLRSVLKRKIRGFEVVKFSARLVPGVGVQLPRRSTKHSAAYDIFSLESKVIGPGEKVTFATDIKAYMRWDEILKLYPRSSQGIKFDIQLATTTSLVDSDYYNNPDNDGNISIILRNIGTETWQINRGDRIAQAVFEKYLVVDHEPKRLPKRVGGIGSTGR